VNEPEDRDPRPTPQPPASGQPYLSPRLREKLTDAAGGDDEDFMKSSFPGGIIATVVVVLLVVVGGWWMIRSNAEKAKAELARGAAVAAAARAAAVADSIAAVQRADSLAAQARADSIAFAKLPRSQQRKILAERAKAKAGAAAAGASTAAPAPAATAAKPAAPASPAPGATAASTPGAAPSPPAAPREPPAPKETGPFAIDTGQFIDEAQAKQVAEAMKAKTPLTVQVVNVSADGASAYHVMLGSFPTRAAAEKAATKVFESGIAEQAAVVPLPKTP